MRILILGYGQVGRVLADLLAREDSITSVLCGDLNLRNEENKGKIALKQVDLSNRESLSKAMGEFKPDIVVNAALPVFNTSIMACCLENKSNYLDAASFWDKDQSENAPSPYKVEQLEFNEAFRQNGLIGLINAGVSPGLTNLLAKACARNLEEVDHIKIRLIEETKANKAVFSWCKEWLIDEINSKPIVYSENRFQFIEGPQDEEYDFPAPFGKRRVAHIAQDEVGTIPLYIKAKRVDIKAYDDQVELIKKKLEKSKGRANASEDEDLADVKTLEEAQFGFVVEAEGREGSKNKAIKKFVAFPKQKEINSWGINANFITYPTALMMKTFILAMNKIKSFGVFPPEALDDETSNAVIEDVKRNGINILRSEVTF